LGDNTYSQRVTPRQIGTDTNWKQVAGGSFHSSAVKTDGTLWVWGYNFYGQLGDNTRTDKLTPIREINSSTNWKQVTAGDSFCSAIKTDGTLWAWGRNTSAHLGDNSFSSRSTPRQIGTDTNWKQVFAGPTSAHAQAIKTNGTLWAWVNNFYGQLGDNTRATRSTPRQIGTDTNWKQVAGGGNHSLAIKTNGTLWGWGYNFYGQVGDNTSGNLNPARSTPRQIGTDTNWKQVAAGHNHCSAIKTDGTLWNWGRGFAVADNSTTSRSTPRQEFSLSANWKQVSGGYNHSLGVKTGIGMDVTPIGIYYSNYALTQGTRALIHGITAGAYPPSDYFGSWIGIQNSTSDDASLQISLPFTWYINNVGETAVRIVSNSYLTFGTTSYTNYSGLSASVPAVSKIHIGAADNSYQRISYLSNPNFLRIRFEGNCSTSGVVGNPGIVFEVTLFNPSLSNKWSIWYRISIQLLFF
jgi:hypothetical protein